MIAYIIAILLIVAVLLVDFSKVKWKFKKIYDRALILTIKIFAVITQFVAFTFGWSIISCVTHLNENICSSDYLNYIVLGVGVLLITLSIVTYVFILLAKDIEIKLKV